MSCCALSVSRRWIDPFREDVTKHVKERRCADMELRIAHLGQVFAVIQLAIPVGWNSAGLPYPRAICLCTADSAERPSPLYQRGKEHSKGAYFTQEVI